MRGKLHDLQYLSRLFRLLSFFHTLGIRMEVSLRLNLPIYGTILIMTNLVDINAVWRGELLAEADDTFYLNHNNVQVNFIKQKEIISKIVVYENGIQIEELEK